MRIPAPDAAPRSSRAAPWNSARSRRCRERHKPRRKAAAAECPASARLRRIPRRRSKDASRASAIPARQSFRCHAAAQSSRPGSSASEPDRPVHREQGWSPSRAVQRPAPRENRRRPANRSLLPAHWPMGIADVFLPLRTFMSPAFGEQSAPKRFALPENTQSRKTEESCSGECSRSPPLPPFFCKC